MTLWTRISCLWTGFWCGAIASFCWSFSLVQSGDEATTKAFAGHLFAVWFWGFLLASLPEIVTLITRTFTNLRQKDRH
jgi:hypothetical protein